MFAAGLACAAVAALIHVYIFYLESVAWRTPAARRVFGTTRQQADATASLAFNQGFYNLFLAIMAGLGIVLCAADGSVVGPTLVLAGTGSMLGAALVLALSSPDNRSAALKQGLAPLAAVGLLVLGTLA